MNSDRVTKKQQILLQFIGDFIKEHGYGPSYREIMRGLDYKSVSTVAVHVDGLIARGWLRKTDNSARSLEITSPRSSTVANTLDIDNAAEEKLIHRLSDYCDQQLKDGRAENVLALIRTMDLLGYTDLAEGYRHKHEQIIKKSL